jgi:hypothetical protein
MNLFLRSTAALLSALFLAGAAVAKPQVATLIVMPQDLRQNPQIISDLAARGINHATVYLNWSDVEAQEGQFDFSANDPYFDQLTQGGLSLIVVLDMGGRTYFDAGGKRYADRTTVPDWLYKQMPGGIMKNFSGHFTPQPDFANPTVRDLSARFVRKAVAHMQQRYPGKVLAYPIGLQEEHEIKYGQTGYQWRDYADSAQAAFRAQTGKSQPVINYTNDISLGLPRVEPLLYTHKQFREARLKEATCFYADAIRSQGGRAMSYFGELFTAHDAIYATSVAEQLADCLDVAVIDYNFYDGYSLSADARVLPMLANYMASVGYQQIMVGAYAEQWERLKKSAELLPVINRTLSTALAQPKVIGYEVGGLQRQLDAQRAGTIDLEKLQSLRVQPVVSATASPVPRLAIGILASTTNYYVWHGDRSGGVNAHREALLAAYEVLSAQPDLAVHVIGEKNLREDDPLLQRLDAILVPLSREGEVLQRLRTDATVRRGQWVPLADVSPALRQALVLSEDKRFYEHSGVDWRAASAAAWGNLWNQRTRGASTITMQLAGCSTGTGARAPAGAPWCKSWGRRWPRRCWTGAGARTRSWRPTSTSCRFAASWWALMR